MSLLQNEDFKTEAQITGAGGSPSQLLNDNKIWITGNSINKTLDDAIVDGDIGGGGSGINYITNGDFKANATGWNTYKDADQATPVDGTAGTALGVTFTRTTTNPLRGTGSGLFSKAATISRRGEGVSDDFTIDVADQGKMLEISFDYKITDVTLTYADGDVRIYIYDVTNAQLIEPSQRDLLANSGQGKYVGYFQAASNSTSYRIIYHVATTTLNAYEIRIDAVRVGPIQSGNTGTFVSDYQDFTLNTISGLASFTTVRAKYRRVGGNAEGYFEITASVDATTTLLLPLNFITGLTVNSSLIGTRTTFGHGFLITSGSPGSYVFELSGESTGFTFRSDSGEFSNTIPSADGGIDTGDRITCQFNVPIQGWSTGVSASEISSNATVFTVITSATAQSIPDATFTKVTFENAVKDYTGSADLTNEEIVIPERGIYEIYSQISFASNTTGNRQFRVRVNGSDIPVTGSNLGRKIEMPFTGALITEMCDSFHYEFNKGDRISLWAYQNSGAALNIVSKTLTCSKYNNPVLIAPTEFVGCRYNRATSLAISGVTIVPYTTKVYDSHNAYNTTTGEYVAPITGKYRVSASTFCGSAAWTAGQAASTLIFKNGVEYGRYGFRAFANTTTFIQAQVTDTVECVKGDIITIRHGNTPNTSLVAGSATEIFMSIEKVD